MGATDREIFEDLVMGLKEILDARDLPSISIEEAIAEGWRNPGYFPRFRSAMARISAKTPLKLTVGRILAQGKHAVVEGRQLIHVVEQGVVRWALRRAEDETPKECPVCGGMLTEAGVDFYAALSSEDKKDYCEVCGSFAGIAGIVPWLSVGQGRRATDWHGAARSDRGKPGSGRRRNGSRK